MLHGCTIEDDCLIGIGAIVLNGAKIGKGSVIAAGAVVPEGARDPGGQHGDGRPGKGEAAGHARRTRALSSQRASIMWKPRASTGKSRLDQSSQGHAGHPAALRAAFGTTWKRSRAKSSAPTTTRRSARRFVEETALFARGVGEETDIVSKEMYTFEDRDGSSLTLRPEATASVMRAYIEHRLDQRPGAAEALLHRSDVPPRAAAERAATGSSFRSARKRSGRNRRRWMRK